MAGETDYNGAKLKELVLYLSERSAEDEGFGMVKLNKLLWRCDFEAYRLLGHAITGETYERQEFGPVARHLLIAMDELAARGYLQWTHVERGPYVRKVPTPVEHADATLFSGRELAIIGQTLAELARHGGKSVSEWSHEAFVGWRVRGDGEEIPYSSAILSLEPLDEAVLAGLEQRLSA